MPVLTMMVGVSYSGKSTIADKIARKTGAVIVSSDAIRGEIYGDESCQVNHAKVFEIVHQRIRSLLKGGSDVIYDATNLSCKRRMAYLRTLKDLEVTKDCVVVVTTPEDIKERMKSRERKVPMEVVHRQLCQFQCPNYYEGWDNITVVQSSSPEDCMASYRQLWRECDIPHDNHHHTLSVKEHMDKAAEVAEGLAWKGTQGDILQDRWVARIHDIGKPRCKSFVDHNGNPTEEAHYIGHQNYGAYYSLIFDCVDFDVPEKISLDNACLIQWHMEHYFRKGEALERFYAMLGSELTRRLLALEKADKMAH